MTTGKTPVSSEASLETSIKILSEEELGKFTVSLDSIKKVPKIKSSNLGKFSLAFSFTSFEAGEAQENNCATLLDEVSLENKKIIITNFDILRHIKNPRENLPFNHTEHAEDEFPCASGKAAGILIWKKIKD